MAGGRSAAAQRRTATGVASPAPLARRTNCGFRRLCRTMGSPDGAGEWLVLDRAHGICHGACAAWRRANAQEYARRGAPTGPAPSAALPASSTSPAGVPVAQLGQLSEPSGSIAKRMAGRNQHIPAKWLASRRSRLVVRRAYPFLVYRSAPVFREPCRYLTADPLPCRASRSTNPQDP